MTKRNEYEVIDTQIFIKRMVLNILPKSFQRMRYYGLQHNNELKKYFEIIAKATGDLIDAVTTYVERLWNCGSSIILTRVLFMIYRKGL